MTARPNDSKTGDLVQLVATEERLERRLAEAKAEAGRVVEAAQEAVRSREAGLEAELAEVGRGLEASAAAERVARVSEIDAAARAEIAAFEGLSPERIAELARYVVSFVAAGEPP
ncbi:MAG TPA: hypothetical protein VF978_01135 [Gemmatimonadales bacterium]